MTGELIQSYDEHSEQVNCCHFTNNSNHLLLATGSSDYFLKVSMDNENYVDKFDTSKHLLRFFSCSVLTRDLLVPGIAVFILA